MKAKPLIGNKSWLGLLNIILLQWFFIRLEAEVDNAQDRNILSLNILAFVVPVTGWRTTGQYIFVGPMRRWNIWSIK